MRCDGRSEGSVYAWRGRPEGPRKAANRTLLTEIRQVHTTHHGRHRTPRVHAILHGLRHTASPGVTRPCASNAACGITASGHERHGGFGCALQTAIATCRSPPTGSARNSPPGGPIKFGQARITCGPTGEGWLYLAAVRDLFTRKTAGWAMRGHMRAELTIAALTMAIKRQEPPPSLTHHSGRGGQYAGAGYRKFHDAAGTIQSKGRKGKLGQRTDGKQLRHFENRTRAPGLRQNPGCRPARLVRLHRRILQSSAARPLVYPPELAERQAA